MNPTPRRPPSRPELGRHQFLAGQTPVRRLYGPNGKPLMPARATQMGFTARIDRMEKDA